MGAVAANEALTSNTSPKLQNAWATSNIKVQEDIAAFYRSRDNLKNTSSLNNAPN